VVELLKAGLNRGEEPRLFFWRDNVGHEVDVVRESGARLLAWEASPADLRPGVGCEPDELGPDRRSPGRHPSRGLRR
jgi:hypothetical protein